MALFNQRKVVKEFTYKGISITVVNAVRGAKCCKKNRKPTDKTCPVCGNVLKHLNVTLVMHEGKAVLHLKRVTPLAAVRRAEEMIDELFRRNDPDAKKGRPALPPPRKRPKRPRKPPKGVPPNPNDGHGHNEESAPAAVPPMPPGFDLDLFQDEKKDNEAAMAQLIEKIKQLGWGEKARQVLNNKKGSGGPSPTA